MKSFFKIFKWLLIGLFTFILVLVLTLLILGIPKPGALSTKKVPRVKLEYLKDYYRMLQAAKDFANMDAWYPDGNGMYVWALKGLRGRPHTLAGPNEQPVFLDGIPKDANGFVVNPNPEKKQLVYFLDEGGNENYQLFKLDMVTQKSEQITPGKGRNSGAVFDRGGTMLAYSSTRRNGTDCDIYVVDPTDKSTDRMIFQEEGYWNVIEWSPDQTSLLISKYISANESQLKILNVENGRAVSLVDSLPEMVSFGSAHWSYDGQYVYYSNDAFSDFKRLHRLTIASREDSVITQDINWDVTGFNISKDDRWIVIKVNEEAQGKLYFANTLEGNWKEILGLPFGSVGGFSFHPLESKIGFNFSLPTGGLGGIYVYDFDEEELEVWKAPEVPKAYSDIPEPVIVRYPTFDSLDGAPRLISAFKLQPPLSFPRPTPVVIDIHGGPESQAGPGIFGARSFLLKRGITVMVPNVRGSTGYGKRFNKLDNGYLRENSVKDIGALLDWIDLQEDLNSERVAVQGGSYGGYMVLAAATHYSDRLICGVEFVGISNFVTFLENTEDYRRDLRRAEYGDERNPNMRAFLESISPANQVNKIGIPLFIFQGENDPRVPVTESRQMVEQLRSAKKKIWYLEADNEGHGIDQPWNVIYVGSAKIQFYEKFLLRKTK